MSVRVLVVEDEAKLALSIKRGLELDGFAVDVAHDGFEGRWLASENGYDAVVLDIMLPGINGYALCAQLREQGNWAPILMLTAKDGELDEAEALDTGADDFLRKPFAHVVLVARLRALIRRGRPERPSALTAGYLRLDPADRVVTRSGQHIELTPREFAVLEYLITHRDTVVTKSDILAHVWDHAFDGDPNIVEVYVGHLRRKIDRPFGISSIQTLRGAGYRLVSVTN